MKKSPFFSLAVLIAAALIISCNSAEKAEVKEESKPVFDLATARTEIEAVNKTFMDLVVKG